MGVFDFLSTGLFTLSPFALLLYLLIGGFSLWLAGQSDYELENRYQAAVIFWTWPLMVAFVVLWSPVFLYDYITSTSQ